MNQLTTQPQRQEKKKTNLPRSLKNETWLHPIQANEYCFRLESSRSLQELAKPTASLIEVATQHDVTRWCQARCKRFGVLARARAIVWLSNKNRKPFECFYEHSSSSPFTHDCYKRKKMSKFIACVHPLLKLETAARRLVNLKLLYPNTCTALVARSDRKNAPQNARKTTRNTQLKRVMSRYTILASVFV